MHVVALMQCNLAPASTFRVRVSTSDPTGVGSLAHDSGTLASGIDPIYPKLVYVIDSAATGRYVRIDLTQASPLPEAGTAVHRPAVVADQQHAVRLETGLA